VCGRTGSGKSTTIRILCSFISQTVPVFIVDSKPSSIYKGWGLAIDDPDDALRTLGTDTKHGQYPRVIYQPPEEFSGPDVLPGHVDLIYGELYDRAKATRRPLCVVTDEVGHVMPGVNPGPGANNILSRGRELRLISLWATQRPARIPLVVYTQVNAFIIHRLLGKADKDMIKSHCGMDQLPALGRFEFIYWDESEDLPPLVWGFDLTPSVRPSPAPAAA
jgi:energy-coupling factor transporter ATP-binding protein EcfA2